MKNILLVFALATTILFFTQCKKDEEEKDTTAPVITLIGSNPLFVDKDSVFDDPGATAVDDQDGDISDNIVVSGNVDTSIEATYYLKYNVADSAGNAADEVTREVTVMIF